MLTLLIDGDILVYQVASRCQGPAIDWGSGIMSPQVADLEEGIGRLKDRIVELKETVSADKVIIALKSETELFRRALLPSYKANRNNTPPPFLRAPLMKWLKENKPKSVMHRPGLEGDDVLGILATWAGLPGEKIIWSIDKDLRQIPGKHLTLDPIAVEEVTEEQGDFLHMQQTLTGDVTDNYKGLPGCGPVKAKKILNGPSLWWPAVVDAYHKAGFNTQYALTQARVARILRASDYDFKRKEPILWTPSMPSSPDTPSASSSH